MQTQYQLAYQAQQYTAKQDELFLQMVRDGMTKTQLRQNIAQRPSLWARFEHWLDKLPE